MTRARSNESRQTVAYPLTREDALVNVGELRLCGALDAGHIALRGDRQQITHFPQAKSQRLRAPDEVQSRELKLAVPAVARRRPIERKKVPMCRALGADESNQWADQRLSTRGIRPRGAGP